MGMGRVTSLVTMATVSPGFTMSRSRGEPVGRARAARTRSSSPAAGSSTALGSRTPSRTSAGRRTCWVRVPILNVSVCSMGSSFGRSADAEPNRFVFDFLMTSICGRRSKGR